MSTAPNTAGDVTDRTDTWCVVGAGSSGLTVAKNFREHGLAVDCYEREDDLGGNWHFGKPNARVYSSTHLISSKPFTEYPDFPMPDRFPDYPHHSHMLDYFRMYATHFGLYDVIEFSTSVERIEPHDGGAAWDVTVRRPNGTTETLRYAGVIIANGHNWYPKMPTYPGEFTGEVIHSADYTDPEILRGKRVLVVGAGNTGCDLAVEGAQNAERTFHSTRRGYWYALKYSWGKPSDQVNDLVLSLRVPRRVHQWLLESTLKTTVGDITRVGLKEPDHRMLETHPIVNQQLVYYVGHGEIEPVDDIERFDGDEVVFTDGRREQVDLVIHCTGYLVHFPFIDHRHLNWADDHPDLYKHVFSRDYDNLFVCGLIQPDSGQFKLVHWQAAAMAKFIEAARERPAAAEAFRRLRRERDDETLTGGVAYKESTRHYYEVNHWTYLEGLESAIGLLERDHHSPTKVMEPLRWALPSLPVKREVISRLPDEDTGRPPILFVHGLGHAAWCWEEHWMPAAAGRGWPCYAVSLRGHGSSDGHDDLRRWKLRDYEHDVMQTIVDLPAPPVLVGHSMGALVVRRVIARYPARAAVLLTPGGARHGLGIGVKVGLRKPGQFLRAAVGQPVELGPEDWFSDELDAATARRHADRLTPESPLAQYELFFAPRPRTSKAPVLVLGAGDDAVVPMTEVVRTARAYDTRAHVFRGMGHDLMLEARWDEPLELMLDWLEKSV